MDLIQILQKTLSPDQNELQAAVTFLDEASKQNLPEFLKQLANVLHGATNDPNVRKAAGLQLKNYLTSKDIEKQREYQRRWLEMPQDVRDYVKQSCLTTLGTEGSRPSSAAQCVAYIAVAEIPLSLWPDLIHSLCQNVTNPNSTELMKEACLETLGYICQDIDPTFLITQANEILTAIVHGMRKEEPSNHVKLAATNSLYNSLEFTKANFEKEQERHFIMQVVCEATQCNDQQVQVSALQCLVKIMSLYYQYMEHYMGPALFAITLQAMKSDDDQIALQGIEFWSNVCDEEVDLAIEASEAQEQGRPPQRVSRHYAKGALQYLVPVLTETLKKQDEHDDEDDWNPCKAAGVCLMLLANCTEDAIVPHVLPFVQQNITSPEWSHREAAVMAFGSILEGPDPSQLKPIVEQALPMLLQLMTDSSVQVRDTTAWTIGRICEVIPEAVMQETTLAVLIQTLLQGLDAEPRVAGNVCWAFNSLGEACYENAERDQDAEPKTYLLSQYFENIVGKLLAVTDRPDANQNNLRTSAYEALMEFIKNSPEDCYQTVQKTTMVILERVQQVIALGQVPTTTSDKNPYIELQSLLCASLQSVLRKMTKEDAPKISDIVMAALLQMLSTSTKAGSVQEDALMAVGTLIEVLGEDFLKYMDHFKPYLLMGLENHQEYQVCQAAVGLVSDLCRGLSIKVMPYCDELLTALLKILNDPNAHRSIKPSILTVFGDIALAIGTEFQKYLEVIMQVLNQISTTQVDHNDYEMVEYLNELRENCLEAYTGIIQGLKGDKDISNPEVQLLVPHLPHVVQFIMLCSADQDISESIVSACSGLVGDLCAAFGPNVVGALDNDLIHNMLQRGKKSKTHKTRTLAAWALKEIKKLKAQASGQVGMAPANAVGGMSVPVGAASSSSG